MSYKSKIHKKLIISLLLIACIGMIATPVFAQYGFEYATQLGLGTRDIRSTIMQVINILLGFLGIVVIGIMLYGGYLYMTSGGAADKVEKAKKIMINAAIGLGIILLSYAIVFFIINALTNATSGPGVCNNDSFCVVPENCVNCPGDCGICPPPPPLGGNFTVLWKDPKNGETNVSLCRLIQMKFNKNINPDTIDNIAPWTGIFTVNAATAPGDVNLWVKVQGGLAGGAGCAANDQCASGVCAGTCQGDLVPGDITLWPDAKGLTFDNTNDFEINTIYEVTIKSDALAPNGLENTLGDRLNLGDYTWTFTTGNITDAVPPTVNIPSIFPADGAIDVCLSTIIKAEFSEPMDISSLLATDPVVPMDISNKNSLYINPNISGFKKSAPSSDTLIANPKELFADFTNYTPTLDSDVIRDSCGNYLDGDGDGVAEFSAGGDDYAPNPVDWEFTTGNTIECTPEITSITPSGYYDDTITILGNYFTGGSVIFNNEVDIFSGGTEFCFDPINYIPDPAQECVVSWTDDQIDVKLPSKGGASNGAKTGDVVVKVGVGNKSNVESFTLLSPRIDNISPKQGGVDQFVTITGSNFGAVQGPNDHVYFRRDNNPVNGELGVVNPNEKIEANYPCSGSVGWTDNQIIISIPDNVNFDDGEDWYIQVVIDEGINNYWGNLANFKFIDVSPGPGLCSVINIETGSPYIGLPEGVLDETVQFSGVRFQDVSLPIDQEVNFGNYSNYISAKSITNWVYGPPDTVNGDVPNIAEGTVGAFLKIDGQNSNTVNFKVHPTTAGPHIDYFEPISGAVGEYITIYGSGFENWDGGLISNVQFSNGAGGLIDGDFAFPPACGNNFWTDSQIIVKVPFGAANSIPLNDDFIIVTAKNSLFDDTSDLSPDEFTVTPGPAGPSICNISPKSGPIGTAVDIFGERFTGATDVKFFNNKSALSYTFIDDENINSAVSPNASTPADTLDDAVSGPITVEVGASISNGYDFDVFDCRESFGGCADIGYAGFECCYDGTCMDPAAGGCVSPTASTYAWNFSTGAYTSCSGYSINQCLASNNCPNSPGQCSPSPAQTNVDTGNDCGDNYCDASFPIDCAGNCTFSDNTCTSPATCDISKDANLIIGGLTGVAVCNSIEGNNVWQINVPCQTGTYLDTNGKCTLGSVSAPQICNPNCADSFDCTDLGGIDGSCIKQNICPSGSTCVADINFDSIDDCVGDIPGKCECCCRVGFSDTDCCAGLTCVDDTCGTDDATYGHCKGCAVWDFGTFFQTLSDDGCGCTNSTRICITDELLALPPANDIGFCGDCSDIDSITFDSDDSGLFDPIADPRHECQSHSTCCWSSITNSCYSCDTLEVIEETCPPSLASSPSPYKEKSNACLNSTIYVKFNLEIDPATLATGVEVYECTAGGRSCTVTAVVAGAPGLIGLGNELIFTPAANLNPDAWHKVVINQNLKDLNGLNLDNNYEWYFKTKDTADLCDIETIQVLPENAVITSPPFTQAYDAIPIGDCTILTATDYNWNWQSSDPSIATITNDGNPSQTATAQDKDGSTQIIASVPAEGKQGQTTLYVLLEDLEVIDYWPDCDEACLNAALGAEFNIAADPSTLNTANIELYEWYCGNGKIDIGEDCDDNNTKSGDGCSGIPKTTFGICNSFITQAECEDKKIDCFWDGFVCQNFSAASSQDECQQANGYWTGIVCVDNMGCLNEGSNGSTSICGNGVVEKGEDCDGNPFPTGCDSITCLHTGSVGLPVSECGDGVVGEGEDCDDGNVLPADGCSPLCLNESTNDIISVPLGTVTPNIDNTIIDIALPIGNYFKTNTSYKVFLSNNIVNELNQKPLSNLNWDFNRDTINDRFAWNFKTKDSYCSPDFVQVEPEEKTLYQMNITQDYISTPYGSPDNCNPKGQKLNPYGYNWNWDSTNESVAIITENNNWPGCGNGNIELGEDCDDGNNSPGDGCGSTCLNEGTSPDMGLVSYWAMDEGSALVAYDSKSENDGDLINGPNWTTGKFGSAVSFDGMNDYVDLTDDGQLEIGTGSLTVSFWGKSSNYVDASIPISKGSPNAGCLNASNMGYEIRQYANSYNFRICHYDIAPAAFFVNSMPFTTTDDKWHHIVGVLNRNDNTMRIYVDGVSNFVTSTAFNPTDDINTTNSLCAGGRYNDHHFDGLIDDVRIYKEPLTGAQIKGIMNQKDYVCGNGIIDFGEDCDGIPFPAGCDINTCLNTGSVFDCGNEVIEAGEDCDDGNTIPGDGCSPTCLNEGTQTDPYIDFYQTATTKSPGTTDIQADVNYCSDDPMTTCGGALPACITGTCLQTTGSGELEVICGFSNDDSCSQGVCSAGFCTNNPNTSCTIPTEATDCNLTAEANTTCDFDVADHACPVQIWGGTCSVNGNVCYSSDDCTDTEFCQPYTDCNYCKNNTSFECRTTNDLIPGPGNSDCRLGVGYDSCCYKRPKVENQFPDPNFFKSSVIDCNNNGTPLNNTDDYCSAIPPAGTAGCQTYLCEDTDLDLAPDTCSAYGRCSNGVVYANPNIYCLSDNDCPQDSFGTCDKSCSEHSQCNDIVCGACRNAQININFDTLMDSASFISDGICSNNSSQSCSQDSNCSGAVCLKNIRLGVQYDNASINQKNCPTGYYAENNLVYNEPKGLIAKITAKIKKWFNKLLGKKETVAAEYWCAIPGSISSFDSNNRTTAVFIPKGLPNNLLEKGLTYRVTVKHNVKRTEGITMGIDNTDDFQYEFTVSDTECQIEEVDVYVTN